MEIEHEIRLCISYLRGIEISSPEILRVIQTRTAVSAILAHRIHVIEKLYESGEIDESEFSFLLNETNMRQRRLSGIPIRFAQTKAREVCMFFKYCFWFKLLERSLGICYLFEMYRIVIFRTRLLRWESSEYLVLV